MRGMPYSLQGKGVIQVAAKAAVAPVVDSSGLWKNSGGGKKEGGGGGVEPRSVLDHRRSPSPPTSSSTLSSSLGGGGGSTDTSGVAAISDKPLSQKWPPSKDISSAAAVAGVATAGFEDEGTGGGGREEWASELQPIPLEIGTMGGEKCGLGMEDWETMFSETQTAVAGSPGHDQSFLRWITGDVEDPSSIAAPRQQQQHHQQQQQQQHFLSIPILGDFESGGGSGGGFGLVDPVFGFEPTGGASGVSTTTTVPLGSSGSVASSGGFPLLSSNSNGNSKILQIPLSPSSLPNVKVPSFGNDTNAIFPSLPSSVPSTLPLPPSMFFQESMAEKPQFYSPNLALNQQAQPHQKPSFLPLSPNGSMDQHLLSPQPKRHHSMVDPSSQIGSRSPFSDSSPPDLFLRRHQQQSFGGLQANPFQNFQQRPMKPKVAPDEALAATHQQQQQQALIEQLLKAAELVEAGNSVNARGILARLNHQLSPHGKPLLRSAFYLKEALSAIVNNTPGTCPSSLPSTKPPATPVDVVLKLSAYKSFCEVSPVLQFTNFTCIQAFLEELNGCNHIHIVDFDIGIGGQWSSFMQELSQRRRTSATGANLSLKITAFVSLSSHHPLELVLTRENLVHFASDLNIPFQFNIMSLDSFDPAVFTMTSVGNEAIAVNIPVGSSHTLTPNLLLFVKQLSPKIVVSVDHGCDHSELPFSRHFLNSLQSYTFLLDSIEAAGAPLEVANNIERFLLQPRIENSVLGRHHNSDKVLPWRTLFTSTGFVPMQFSNFTETQAECLLKRMQVRGFRVEKHQSSLALFWQRGELVSVSAWRC